jgi:hypothetical protein
MKWGTDNEQSKNDLNGQDLDKFIAEEEPLNDAIVQFIDALEAKGINRNEIHKELMAVVQGAIQGDIDMQNSMDDEDNEGYDSPTLSYRDSGGTDGG